MRRDGVGVHYQVFGDGERAVLLLPTWSIVHSDVWRHQVPHLAARYTVIAFDGRGNGASGRPADPSAYAEREFADDALAVLDEVGVAGSGHEPQCRAPERVNGCLDAFLDRHYPSAQPGSVLRSRSGS